VTALPPRADRGVFKEPPMNRSPPRAAAFGILMLAALAALPACNTIRGIGRDTQAGGRAVERTATETQQQMEERQRREREQQGQTSNPNPP